MLKYLSAKNYRNINNFEAQIGEKGNLIIAPNGSGKTNLLEAIYYSVFGESFKPINTHSEIIGPDEEFAKVLTKWNLDTLEVTVSDTNKLNRNFKLNQKKTMLSKISSKFPIILFAPHSVDIVIGEPALRRNDLNAFLSILNSDYKKLISQYNIILKNRNAVIKQVREGKVPETMIDYWTEKLVNLAYEIFSARADFFAKVKDFFADAQKVLFGIEHYSLDIEYLPNVNPTELSFKETLEAKYINNRSKEIIVGKTLYGVHKDDYRIVLNEDDLKYKGSRGQQRIGISVLKFAQLLLYYQTYKTYPLLLLDDIMSELDDNNRLKIANYLLEKDLQFILTSAENKEVPDLLKESSTFLQIGE